MITYKLSEMTMARYTRDKAAAGRLYYRGWDHFVREGPFHCVIEEQPLKTPSGEFMVIEDPVMKIHILCNLALVPHSWDHTSWSEPI